MSAAFTHLSGMRRALALNPSQRNAVLLVVACVATFCGILFLFKDSANIDRDVGGGAGVERVSSTPAEAQPAPSTASVGTVPANSHPVPPGSAMPASVGAQATEPPAESSANPSQPPAEVSDLADADERAAAIREVGGVATPQALHVLEVTVRNDDVPRNRLLAVNFLRSLAKRGDPGGRIVELLRLAMADSDPNVAAHAREAYREVAP